jgi:hypothetical protein
MLEDEMPLFDLQEIIARKIKDKTCRLEKIFILGRL